MLITVLGTGDIPVNKTDKNDKRPCLYEVHILVAKGQGDVNKNH